MKDNSKMSKGLGTHFYKEDIQVTNKYMKRRSISLIIGEIQIKTTMMEATKVSINRWMDQTYTYT